MRRAMSSQNRRRTEMNGDKAVEATTDVLVHAYEEQMNLYSAVRDMALRQRALLGQSDLKRFGELLDEEQDILRIIGQIESELADVKAHLLMCRPEVCP